MTTIQTHKDMSTDELKSQLSAMLGELAPYLRAIHDLRAEIFRRMSPEDMALTDIVDVMRDIEYRTGPDNMAMGQLTVELKNRALAAGEAISEAGVQVTYRKAHTARQLDSKAYDAAAAAAGVKKDDFYKEVDRPASVQAPKLVYEL